jgi:1-acyl-sn-glycerol-3-phosphate acyltransferase
MNDKFYDIRPYRDDEIADKLKSISNHPWLVDFMKLFKFKNVPKIFDPILNVLIRHFIKRLFSKVKTVQDFQREVVVKNVLDKIIEKTTSSLNITGLENINSKDAFLYISNHRDIALDSAFLNLLLDKNNIMVSEIAFGDNLLINDFISDIIRINRAFIVKRKLPPKELLKASIILSEYINTTINGGRSIWIAQREGRAKDGNDRTNPALLKMLHLFNRSKKLPFSELVRTYKIIPVSISYELDPCDRLKAWDLFKRAKHENYKKRKNDDLMNMSLSMTGKKEGVSIHVGKPIEGHFETETDLAVKIDRCIHESYFLWPTNYAAYDIFFKTDKYKDKYTENEVVRFKHRFQNLPEGVVELLFKTYAMPVVNREELGG